MKSILFNKNIISIGIFISTLFITFSLGEIYYNSIDGTDFYRYFNYIEYFRGGIDSPGREQGLLYYWFVSLFIKLSRPYYLIYDWETIYSSAIQLANLLIYCVGLLGLYYLLKSFKYKIHEIFFTLAILNCFPPMFGARLIMKPEIIGFALLPWVFVMIDKYFKTEKRKYLIYSIPLISALLTSKGSVIGITIFSLLYMYITKIKSRNKKDLFISISFFILLTTLLFLENNIVNGYNIFTHPQTEQYLNRASISFLFNINFLDLFMDPFRNTHANSFIGITIIDTFGDYFERYWDHERSLFSRNRIIFFNNELIRRWVSTFITIVFIFSSFYKKNTKMYKYNFMYLIGAFILLLSSFGIFGLNFNPSKGDTLKTHYYSFVLAISFAVIVIGILSKKTYNVQIASSFIALFLFLFIIGFPKNYTGEYNEQYSYNEELNSKLESSISCFFVNNYIDSKTNIDSKCINKEIALCGFTESYNKPKMHSEGYLIFISDEFFQPINLKNEEGNVVTVTGYAECINYQKGGYINAEIAYWGNSIAFINQLTAVLIILMIIIFIVDTRKKR